MAATHDPTAPGAHAGLALESLVRRYRRGFWLRPRAVVDGVDLTVPRGATWGLIGPNGSGKSTLLRLASGVEPPDAGRVRLGGLDPRRGEARAALGYLPEGCPYPPELSAPAVLALLDRARSGDRRGRRARVGHWIERVGLTHAGRTPLGRYSSGMRRRFGLAAACQHAPRVLLLDEPSAGLDAEGVALLESLLSEARERGATTLVCSHTPSDLFASADRIAVLVAGRVATVAAPTELAARVRRLELEVRRRDPSRAPDLARLAPLLESEGLELRAARPSAAVLDALYRDLSTGASDGDHGAPGEGASDRVRGPQAQDRASRPPDDAGARG